MEITNRLLRLRTVMDMTGLSRASIYGYMAAGSFPNSVKIGARSIAWSEQSVREWVDARLAHRKPQPSGAGVSLGR